MTRRTRVRERRHRLHALAEGLGGVGIGTIAALVLGFLSLRFLSPLGRLTIGVMALAGSIVMLIVLPVYPAAGGGTTAATTLSSVEFHPPFVVSLDAPEGKPARGSLAEPNRPLARSQLDVGALGLIVQNVRRAPAH